MRSVTLLAATAALSLGFVTLAEAAAGASPAIAAAVADPHRPAEDVARDAARKPAEMLAFAEVRPGEVIAEMLPGRGYFTRIFAKAVAPNGRVYAVIPEPKPDAPPPAVDAIAADPAYGDVKVVQSKFATLALPEKADLVWTSQNYHDLRIARAKLDIAAANKAVYDALKPGGLYIVLDHAAAPGASLEVTDQLHRIDPAIVRKEVEAAGFVFEGESDVLRNSADDHTKKVFDPAIRGHTDQFIYKFRKPAQSAQK